MPKLYQNIQIKGVKPQNPRKNGSKFWNEGKFINFIQPLLYGDHSDETFVEMGCNAGLFLQMAKDEGYRHVIGIEKDRTPVKEGLRYRDSIGYDYQILKRSLGDGYGGNGTFDIDELPLADLTVLSTFHYYIFIDVWLRYLDRLRSKTRDVLIISRPEMKRRHWLANAPFEDLRVYFSDWKLHSYCDGPSKEGDPHPRDLFSCVFKSPLLERVPIDSIGTYKSDNDEMEVATRDLAQRVTNGEQVNLFDTGYYTEWAKRKDGKWDGNFLMEFVLKKYKMMCDIRDNGMKEPIIVQKDGKISDGGHRWIIMKALGYKSVIVRRLK